MLAEKFRDLSLEVGFGRNLFTMKRGSFKYRQEIWSRRKMVKTNTNILSDTNFELKFIDPQTGSICSIFVTEKDGLTHIDFYGTLPEGINLYWISFPRKKDEHFYGCGETYSKFDLSGEKVRIWVAEHQNVARISSKVIRQAIFGKRPHRCLPFKKYESYYAQPTFVSSEKYFLHADVNLYSEFDFRKKDRISLYFQEEPHIVLGEADDFPALSKKLSYVLGRQKKLPDWIYDGTILAVQQGTKAVDEKLEKSRKAGIKVCGVWAQDWCGCRRTGFGYQVMWNWRSDQEQYPDLHKKIEQWKNQGVRFLGYINPFLALEKELYAEASAKGYCVKNRNGGDYLVTITTFPAAMIDFTNPAAYEWYKDIIKKNMIGIGMCGWMADFGEYLPVDSVLYDRSNPEEIHNQWPAIWAKLNREAIEECGVQDEVFFFTRAGHTGTVGQSSMMWTGDQHVDWSVDDGIGSVIPATLSLAMSGCGICHSDSGGYTTVMNIRRSKELLMRWQEMNVFSPLFRGHEGNQPEKNAQFDFDEEVLAHTARCSRMHFALKDYLQFLVDEAEQNGTPVMRPLFYHYSEKSALTEKSEYLLGKDVLVCPVLDEGKTSRRCYLPDDRWINIFSKKEYTGGTFDVQSDIGSPAVFVRKGSAWEECLFNAAGKGGSHT